MSSVVSIDAKQLHLVSLRASAHPHTPAASMNYAEIAVLFLEKEVGVFSSRVGGGVNGLLKAADHKTLPYPLNTRLYTQGSGFNFRFLVERVERS